MHAGTLSVVVPRPKHELAREHLMLARSDIDDEDERGAVNALFYAAEAAAVAIADVHEVDTERNHRLKADAATELYARGVLERDCGPLLRKLNQARKDIWYEGEEPDFGDQDLESVADDVEWLVQAAEAANVE